MSVVTVTLNDAEAAYLAATIGRHPRRTVEALARCDVPDMSIAAKVHLALAGDRSPAGSDSANQVHWDGAEPSSDSSATGTGGPMSASGAGHLPLTPTSSGVQGGTGGWSASPGAVNAGDPPSGESAGAAIAGRSRAIPHASHAAIAAAAIVASAWLVASLWTGSVWP